MKAGLRAWDADTHVNPAAEVLERYVDPSFRPRLAELAPYRVADRQMIGGTPDTHQYRMATKLYRRILGEAGPARDVHRPAHPLDGDASSRGSGCRTIRPRTASRTWTMRGSTRTSWCPRSGSASWGSRTSTSRSD